MKRNLILSMVASLFLVAGLNAQDQQPRQDFQQRRQQQMEEMKKELALNKDQITKFDAIQKEFDEKMTKARQSAGDDREAMRSKMQEMNKERDLKIEKVLTPDQVKKYKDIQAKQAAARQQRGPGGGGR